MTAVTTGLGEWWRKQTVLDLRVLADPDPKVLLQLSVVGKNLVLLAGIHIAVVLAGGWDLVGSGQLAAGGLWLPMGLGALMLADALLAHRHSPSAIGGMPRPQITFSTLLALVIWLAVTWHGTAREHFPLVLAGEALLLTLSYYLLRVPEIP